MKRFKYEEKYGTMKKLNYKIAFPLEIKIVAVRTILKLLILLEIQGK